MKLKSGHVEFASQANFPVIFLYSFKSSLVKGSSLTDFLISLMCSRLLTWSSIDNTILPSCLKTSNPMNLNLTLSTYDIVNIWETLWMILSKKSAVPAKEKSSTWVWTAHFNSPSITFKPNSEKISFTFSQSFLLVSSSPYSGFFLFPYKSRLLDVFRWLHIDLLVKHLCLEENCLDVYWCKLEIAVSCHCHE